MKYPVGNNDITKFEEQNNGLISVNVYKVFNDNYITQERITKIKDATFHVTLFKIEGGSNKFHYARIKDLSKLLYSQLSRTKNKVHM